MKVNEIVSTTVRSNEFELKNEIQRAKDKLATLQVGTAEYAEALKAYETLTSLETEKDKVKKEIRKTLLGGGIGIAGLLLYRKLIDKAADPFFKEIGKTLLRIVHI
jgi:CRISPR/Cas system CSM-associated protein Csm5 (group 7 of RAMP superfamily)